MNEIDVDPLRGWVIAICGGRCLVGRLHNGSADHGHALACYLKPVYELQRMARVVQEGRAAQMQIGGQVTPVLWYASISSIAIPSDGIVIECARLSSNERRQLYADIQQCEQMVVQMRAADAGVVVAPKMPDLPPMRKG